MAKYGLVSTVLLSLGAIVGIREYLKPKDIQTMLRWKGVRLISSDNGWSAAYYENEDKLKKISLNSAKELENWCIERFKYGLEDEAMLSAVEEYCKDDPKTVMGNIIRAGEKERFIKDAKGFSIIYAVSGDKDKLNSLINTENTDNKVMGKKLEAWCKDQEKKDVRDLNHLSDVKKYCYDLGARSIRDLLSKKGLKIMEIPEEYRKRFWGELIDSNDLYEDIRSKYGEEGIDSEVLSKWCNGYFTKELDEKNLFPDVYAKVESRCTKRI